MGFMVPNHHITRVVGMIYRHKTSHTNT